MLHDLLRGLVAQSTGADGGFTQTLFLIVPMGLIMYFLLWRPQQKQQQEHEKLLQSLRKGDEVVTTGGLVGRIHAVTDKVITLEVAKDVKLKILKSAVQTRGTVASEGEAEAAPPKDADEKKEAK